MATAFKVGDKVRANADVQGLNRGWPYEVTQIDECDRGIFGNFVRYGVQAHVPGIGLASEVIWVTNGHLLLDRIPPPAPPKLVARIEYTMENRRGAVRKSVEVPAEKVEKTIARLEEKNGFNFVTSYAAVQS